MVMNAQDILKKLGNPNVTLDIGNEKIRVGLHPSMVVKGTPFKDLKEDFKRAAEQNLLSSSDNEQRNC